ncbi:MAG: TetR/AcrR family transcriptional regulator C-terminal domain-containing protein [Vicinamibacteria bacterium]
MARKPEGDKRRQILDAAVSVFAQKGYFTARISDIAGTAGVADGTIYLYFKNKEDIVVSLFADVLERHLARAKEEIASVRTPREKLLAIARHHLAALSERKDVAILFQTELRQSTLLARISSKELRGYFDLLSKIIEEGQKGGAFRPELPRSLVVQSFFGALDELVTSWILSPTHYNLVDLAEPVTDLFLGGIDRTPHRARTKRRAQSGEGQ